MTPEAFEEGAVQTGAPPVVCGPGKAVNPFSTHRLEPGCGGYIFPEGESWEETVELLNRARWRAELVGDHGAGKSTLLADLCLHLTEAGKRVLWWQFSDRRRLPPRGWFRGFGKADVIACDGAERLLPGVLWLLRAATRWRGKGLLITTHRRLGLPGVIAVRADAAALGQKVSALMGVPGPGPALEAWVARRLAQHGGDSREVLFELYKAYEEGSLPGEND